MSEILKNEAVLRIAGALIGLCQACVQNEFNVTHGTGSIVAEALCALDNENIACEKANDIIEILHAEKNRISPSCRYCESPCGRTADYDLAANSVKDPECFELKKVILDRLIAFAIIRNDKNADKFDPIIRQRLCMIGDDWSFDTLDGKVRDMHW